MPPRVVFQAICEKEDCYKYPKLIRGGVIKLGAISIINDVKYGYHCGKGRGSKKEPLDKVDAACQLHDNEGGGKTPYKNGNGVTAAQSCSTQLKFVDRLQRINTSRLTNGAPEARLMLLGQFPSLEQIHFLCNRISTGETVIVGAKDYGEGAVKDVENWGKTTVKDTKETAINTGNWVERGILGASSNEWRVEIDSCHKNLDDTGTTNKITTEFWSKDKKVKSQSRNGVKANCILNREYWSITTDYTITHVIVKTDGTDGFFIDEVELYKGGKSKKRHGRDNGSGWCLSKDPKDGGGAWRGKVSNSRCVSQIKFKY
jgi:hypothetical protein